jgi:hypothetical protein
MKTAWFRPEIEYSRAPVDALHPQKPAEIGLLAPSRTELAVCEFSDAMNTGVFKPYVSEADALQLGVTPRPGTPTGEPGVYFTPDSDTAIQQYATGKNGYVYRIEVPKEAADRFLLSERLNNGAAQ